MSGMTASAQMRQDRELLGQPKAKVAVHVPTNRRYTVKAVLHGVGACLESLDGGELVVDWAAWMTPELWSKQP